MSHSFVMVIVEPHVDNSEISRQIEELMAPFDETIQVEEYMETCHCVGSVARQAAYAQTQDEVGSLDSFRNSFKEGDDWTEHIKPYTDRAEELEAQHPLKGQPHRECAECGGSGEAPSTYNPKSKWDWWRVGGRWDGLIQGAFRSSADNGFNFSDDHERLANNACQVSEVLQRVQEDPTTHTPFAILTPDGEWHESGRMGWWGVVSDKQDDWEEKAQEILAQYPEHLAVGCDLHI
jgi:hypothetical protein